MNREIENIRSANLELLKEYLFTGNIGYAFFHTLLHKIDTGTDQEVEELIDKSIVESDDYAMVMKEFLKWSDLLTIAFIAGYTNLDSDSRFSMDLKKIWSNRYMTRYILENNYFLPQALNKIMFDRDESILAFQDDKRFVEKMILFEKLLMLQSKYERDDIQYFAEGIQREDLHFRYDSFIDTIDFLSMEFLLADNSETISNAREKQWNQQNEIFARGLVSFSDFIVELSELLEEMKDIDPVLSSACWVFWSQSLSLNSAFFDKYDHILEQLLSFADNASLFPNDDFIEHDQQLALSGTTYFYVGLITKKFNDNRNAAIFLQHLRISERDEIYV